METTKQVSVFLENKPGRLARVLLALAQAKVNVVALTIMDSHEQSVLRLVTSDVPRTQKVLDALNASHAESEVLTVELKNHPGALAHVCEQLAGEHINIDYAYCSSGGATARSSESSRSRTPPAHPGPQRRDQQPPPVGRPPAADDENAEKAVTRAGAVGRAALRPAQRMLERLPRPAVRPSWRRTA